MLRLARNREELAHEQAERADGEQNGEGEGDAPSDRRRANRASIRLSIHRPKASETRPPRPTQAIVDS